MTEDDIQRYLIDTRGIGGWFFPIDASLFAAIDEVQRERVAGNLFEIGVHHGKSAIALARMLKDGEVLGVCDIFEEQRLNLDRSGEGSREIFLRNMSRWAPHAAPRIRVFPKRSADLAAEDTTTECRFVHIDGGHRPADVAGDLEVARVALSPLGVVAVDDVFNPSWPGVGEGLYWFLGGHPDVFTPVIIGGNKVFLARSNAAARYAEWVRRIADGEFFRPKAFRFEYKEWLGRPVLTVARLAWVDLHPLTAAWFHRHGLWRSRLPTLRAR